MSFKQRTVLLVAFIALSSLFYVNIAQAHRSGCHRWHSCPSDSGSYSCGDWGYSNYCGNTYTYTPPAPVITSSNNVKYITIPRTTEYKINFDEYPDYEKVVAVGKDGQNKVTTTIHYSNSVETSRDSPVTIIAKNPAPKIIERGGRLVPTGFINSIQKVTDDGFLGWNRGKYNILGRYKPDVKIALLKNGDVMSTMTTYDNGYFGFHNIAASDKDIFSIATDNGRDWFWETPKTTRISEPYTFTSKGLKMTSEYYSIHGHN